MDSDDSDFYGDSATVTELRERVRSFDTDGWIRQHMEKPGHPRKQSKHLAGDSNLHNPYSGISYAWQLTETVDDFLARLPPATTDQTVDTPWIFICNPYIPRVHKTQGGGQNSLDNEDEAPDEVGSQVSVVEAGGRERLEIAAKYIGGLTKSGQRPAFVEKEVQKERKQAVDDILSLAHAAKVRTGKVTAL
jgi:hypothetical protein